eukprot:5642_1
MTDTATKFVNIRLLLSHKDIEAAQKILYLCHIKLPDNPWKFSKNNPSQIRIEYCANGDGKLVDKYTKTAYWFGAFVAGKLIGCLRAIVVKKSEKLEMETYLSFPKSISNKITDILTKYNCQYRIECNRTCVLPKYRNYNVRNYLIRGFILSVLNRLSNPVVIHTLPGYLPQQYLAYNLKSGNLIFGKFKYEKHDPSDVYVFCSPPVFLKNNKNASKSKLIKTKYDKDGKFQEIIFQLEKKGNMSKM